jgi:bifunctional non-homologous end joining protein LigD
LHSGKYNDEVQLYAFDILAMGGDDLRDLPLSMRERKLSRLLARRPDEIFLIEFEQGEIGPDLFRKACEFGLEGLVSKHRDRPYRGGPQKHWIKVNEKPKASGNESRNGYFCVTRNIPHQLHFIANGEALAPFAQSITPSPAIRPPDRPG